MSAHRKKDAEGLSARERIFVDEYLIDLNATQAAIRAGYSPNSAARIANDLMKKPEVEAAIAKRMAERSKRTGYTADRVLRELAKIAFVNINDIIDPHTGMVREGVDIDELANVASVKRKVTSGKIASEEVEVKTYDKIKALELFLKHMGLLTEKVNLTGDDGLNVTVHYGKVEPTEEDEPALSLEDDNG